MKFATALALLLAAFAPAPAHAAAPVKGSPSSFFVKAEFSSPAELKWQPDFAKALSIPVKVVKKTISTPAFEGEDGESWRIESPMSESLHALESYSLDIRFPKLEPSQLSALNKKFKAGVAPRAGGSYELIEFLPAAAQAMYEHHYINNRQNPGEEAMAWAHELAGPHPDVSWISRVTNCWSTAFEVLRRSSDQLSVHFVSEGEMKTVLTDDAYSSEVAKLNGKDIALLLTGKPPEALAKIEPGDLLLYYYKVVIGVPTDTLAHVSVAIDGSLVYEKTNPGSSFPARIALLKDSVANLARTQGVDIEKPTAKALKDMRLVIRRFNKKPLPTAKELFALSVSPGMFIDPSRELTESKLPAAEFFARHNAVTEMGTGGGILFESLYEIVDFKLVKDASGKSKVAP